MTRVVTQKLNPTKKMPKRTVEALVLVQVQVLVRVIVTQVVVVVVVGVVLVDQVPGRGRKREDPLGSLVSRIRTVIKLEMIQIDSYCTCSCIVICYSVLNQVSIIFNFRHRLTFRFNAPDRI